MLELKFPQGLAETDIQTVRVAVQDEAAKGGLSPQHGFVLLFVVDELLCNVMEHAGAGRAQLSLQASAAGFRVRMVDDGEPFDTAGQVKSASKGDLRGADDRRLGLNLVGRLVDEIEYHRTADGQNLVELAKSF